MTTLYTVGHGATSAEHLLQRLGRNDVSRLVDVRTAPGSRRHPQFGRAEMERWVAEAGIAYRWEPALGGFRRVRPDSANVVLRNASFRGYADYMEAAPFHEALRSVLHEAASRRTVVMCSETLWWRCHRRLIADAAVLLHEATVLHIDGGGAALPHRLTAGVRRLGDLVRYDAPLTTGGAPLPGM